MKSKKAVSAASYPSRIFENYQVLNDSGYLVVCPNLNMNVAANSKNKETFSSLFFCRRQRSKVIFRVTQNSLRILLNYFRKYLALRGCRPLLLRPMVAYGEVGWNRSLPLPTVAALGHSVGAHLVTTRYAWRHLPMVSVFFVLPTTSKT